jgi:dihydroflavonol-4-reductase
MTTTNGQQQPAAKKVFITGATGFVGSWVAEKLVAAGHQVYVLRRQTSKTAAIDHLNLPDEQHIIGDILHPETYQDVLQEVDWVFHVAAISDYWRNDKETIYRVNVEGTRSLLQASETANVKRFIFTSSAFAVGFRYDGISVDETNYFNIDPVRYAYAHSKLLGEHEVYQSIIRGLDAVIVNPVVVLGPRDLNQISGSLLIWMAQNTFKFFQPIGAGGFTMVDVRDVAAAHLAAAERGCTGERYLLGTTNISQQALLKYVSRYIGFNMRPVYVPELVFKGLAYLIDRWHTALRTVKKYSPNFLQPALSKLFLPAEGNQLRLAPYHITFDSSKAHAQLYQPQYEPEQTINESLDWYRENGFL